MEKELLSETAKRFIDGALDTVHSLDGAPEHDTQQKSEVMQRIAILKERLHELEQSYLQNAPSNDTDPVDPEYIAETGHS